MLARRDEEDIWFLDECHFQQHGSRCAMWIPPEDVDPVVLQAPTRKSMGIFGAVRARDGKLIIHEETPFNAQSFQTFLSRLIRKRRSGRRMRVVLDNASWHKSATIWPWLRARSGVIYLDFLPPYSPDLNHIERVWKLTRRLCTHNQYFDRLEDLVDVVVDQLYGWSQPNETLAKLCAII